MWLIAGFILVLIALYWLVPKGTVLHEVLRLPQYWWQLRQIPAHQMIVERYHYGPQRRQYLLYCRPLKNQMDKKHVIFYFHGGGWAFGSPEMFRAKAQMLINQGYHVILPSHRRIPRFQYHHIREDLNLCLLKSLEIMEKYGQKGKKLLLGGMSAGGNVAALLAFDRTQHQQMGLSRDLFGGVLLFGAPIDLHYMPRTPILWAFAGWRQSNRFQLANPRHHLNGDESLPVFCIHGSHDGMVPLAVAEGFLAVYPKELITFHLLEKGTHLESGHWSFPDNINQERLLQWLEKLEQ
ncbi:MAG: alpha/beta hydrolase [Bacteroidota bacterium]